MKKIEVTEKFLLQVLSQVREMRRYGSYKDLVECDRIIKNTKNYLNKGGNLGY